MDIKNAIDIVADGYREFSDEKEELCAVLFEEDGQYRCVAVANRHEDKINNFRISNKDVKNKQHEGETLVAVIHTHADPFDAEPSYEDVKNMPDGLVGVVIKPSTGEWTMYDNKIGILGFRS